MNKKQLEKEIIEQLGKTETWEYIDIQIDAHIRSATGEYLYDDKAYYHRIYQNVTFLSTINGELMIYAGKAYYHRIEDIIKIEIG